MNKAKKTEPQLHGWTSFFDFNKSSLGVFGNLLRCIFEVQYRLQAADLDAPCNDSERRVLHRFNHI